MTGVKRGQGVAWTETTPGARRYDEPTTLERTGTVLDKGPAAGEWWVMPHGERRAVVLHARDMSAIKRRAS